MATYGQSSYGFSFYGLNSKLTKRILTFSWDLDAKKPMLIPKVPTVFTISHNPQKVVVERIEKRGER